MTYCLLDSMERPAVPASVKDSIIIIIIIRYSTGN